MKQIRFDFNNMFGFSIGQTHGVELDEIKKLAGPIRDAHKHLTAIIEDTRNRIGLNLEWAALPFQDEAEIRKVHLLGREIARKYKNVLFLGIGGSYLGLKAAQDALLEPYYNDFSALRRNSPKVYFEGNNLDPDTLNNLLKSIKPQETCVVVISKSGETTETKAAFTVVEAWLKKHLGAKYGRNVIAITDPESGTLRKKVKAEQEKDVLSFRNLPLLKGVGGRYSEFNMGLLHLAITGINLREVLRGAADMAKRCSSSDIYKNPAYLYAVLCYILYHKKGKAISIMMPFSEKLKSTGDWYCQLLAESLGKKYTRKVKVRGDGTEIWERDLTNPVHCGRTPIACRGTNDLHSIQQNNIEGENDKVVTFIKVEDFEHDIRMPLSAGILSSMKFSELIQLAQEATEWSLVRESRPNCTITLPRVSPYYWAGLLFFLEMATAFEGELLNVNAFDQPGVEGYKNYMYYKLGKAGISEEIISEIKNFPLIKKKSYIL